MSLNLNRVTLAGHLTRDPELRQVGPDRAVANFGLAINRRWRNQQSGEMVEEATFVDIEAWGRTGELVGQYLKKGSPAYIEGRLKLDAWEDKEGQKRNRLKVVAETVQFLAARSHDGDSAGAGASAGAEGGEAPASQPPAAAAAQPPRAKAKAMAGAGDEPPF